MFGEWFVLGVGFGWNVEEFVDYGVLFVDWIVVMLDKFVVMWVLWVVELVYYEGMYVLVLLLWVWLKLVVVLLVLFGCWFSVWVFEVIVCYGDGW